ncbi:ATP-dependent helicase/nuclease subunit B [Candidatus Thermokryptus mobilis]|uniref:ATP-dependent helicase/nuclease subunit B n=1 Tax=Candidatus Thermokryptus mobilis TaxID=1643428 RepID=A0A0S4NAV2_9BACT|nr:PD-(D/E)XK nuclease family protein [Candidatus Thermokryptus mobilis]CUU08423.1 ATP-dependent helicase/nuclease subunit B [Candidatus Thermokryptus mobilis]
MGVILSFPAGRKVFDVREEIKSRIERGEFKSFIYIVPTRRKIRELQREFLSYAPGNIAPELNLFTLELFARKLYFSSGVEKPKRLISETIQGLVFQMVIDSVIEQLEYFKPPGTGNELPKGTVNKLIDTIVGLKEDGIYPKDLLEQIDNVRRGEDRVKLKDIALIYEKYEGLLLSNSFVDVPGIFKELNNILTIENANLIFRNAFFEVDSVFIDGFSVFRLPEINLIKMLTKVDGLRIVILFDYFEKNNNLFGHLDECYNKFLDAGFEKLEVKPKTENDKFARYLNKYLFNYIGLKFDKYNAKDFVTLIEAKDRVDEVKTIARLIKSIVNERSDIDLSKICVATYRPEKYTNLFREIFPIYGIPANITDRFYLERSPLVSAIISLLDIPANDYAIGGIVKVLMSSYFDFCAGTGRELKPDNIYSASKELKIKSGREFWKERVERRIDFIKAKLDVTSDEDEYNQLVRELNLFNEALLDFEGLMKIVDKFSAEMMTPSEFKERLREVLRLLRVEEQILKFPRSVAVHDEIERDARAYQKFIEVVDEVLEVFEFNMKRRERYKFNFYVDLIKKAISRVRYNIRQKYGYGVYVTALEETRGLNFDVMIIAGLVDTEFPSVYEPEVFLSEELRKTEWRHKLDERYLFYQGVVNFKTHLYLTYPRTDGENELVRSRFIDSLEQVVEFEKVSSDDFDRGIFSMLELYDKFGRFLKFELGERGFDFVVEKFPKLVADYGDKMRYIFDISRVNISRSNSHDENYAEYKGIIKADYYDEKIKLGEHEERIFSISQLETYGKCPFRYFSERVLNLRTFEEIEDLLTPIERGILYHEVLYKFYNSWVELGLSIAENVDKAKELIVEIALEKASEFEINHPLWEVEVDELVENMKKFIDLEASSIEYREYKPIYFEVAFGPKIGSRAEVDVNLSTDKPIQIGRVKIQGKIDRIDVKGNKFLIYDYKTGRYVPTLDDLDRGIHLQIPIYIKVAEEIFKDRGYEMEGVGGVNYIVRGDVRIGRVLQKGEGRRSKKILDEEEYKKKIDLAVEKVNVYVDGIVNGKFGLTSHDDKISKICWGCPFIEICRISEVKFGIQIRNWG